MNASSSQNYKSASSRGDSISPLKSPSGESTSGRLLSLDTLRGFDMMFIMGAAFCMVELTSALPYFGFLALLTSYHLIFPLALLFMMIYNFMYMLPLILLYFGYNKLQGTTTIKKSETVLDKVSSYIVPVVVSLVGILLAYYGVTSLM